MRKIIPNISYFSESGNWLDKILLNDICFAKFAKVFPPPKFCTIWYSSLHSGNLDTHKRYLEYPTVLD